VDSSQTGREYLLHNFNQTGSNVFVSSADGDELIYHLLLNAF
jgi:hypothetical protein